MTLTLEAARAALRRLAADAATPPAWSDDDLDTALAIGLAQLDQLAPSAAVVRLAAGGTDRLPLPSGVQRVLAVLHAGQPLAGWSVWAGELVFAEPVSGSLELRCWQRRTLPDAASDPLPLSGPAEEAFLLAAAVEALLVQALARQGRHQGPVGPLVAALEQARAQRERAARALPRVLCSRSLR
jgi:hypothetical protein